MLQKILFFLLFLLPFVILPIGVSHFETGKVIIGELLIGLLIIFSLQNQKWREKTMLSIPILLLLTLFGLGLFHLFYYSFDSTFWGNAFRLQGVLLLWILVFFTIVVSRISLPKISIRVIILLLLLQLLAAMFLTVTNDGRGVGTLGEPNSLAGFVVFLWPFIFLLPLENKNQKIILRVMGTIFAVLILIFSGSRSGSLAFGIEAVFLFTLLFFRVSLLKSFLLAICLFLLSLTLPLFQTETVYENRAEIWQTAIYAGYEHPYVGWGFGNTEVAFKEYNEKLYNRLRGYYIDSSHNIFLDMWVQGGFIGLAAFVGVVYYAIRFFIRYNNRLALCLLLGLMTVVSFNPVSSVLLIQFWWIISQSLGLTDELEVTPR